jgi:hypothetical protein
MSDVPEVLDTRLCRIEQSLLKPRRTIDVAFLGNPMSHTIAAPDVPVVLPKSYEGSPSREAISTSHPGLWRGLSGWAKEALLLVGVVWLLPITILAIGIPFALAINGLLLAAGWVWKH